MIENTITHYDYIMAQIYWEISKDFEGKSRVEQKFLNSLLRKYQIMVLMEPGYSKKDKEERINDLVAKVPELYGEPQNVLASFNKDIQTILGEEIPIEPERMENIVQSIPVATMGMQTPTEKKIIQKTVSEYYKSKNQDARKELLVEKKRSEFEIDHVKNLQNMILQLQQQLNGMEQNIANRIQMGVEEQLANTQMEGDRVIEFIEKKDEKTSDQLAELIERTEGLQNLTGISLSKKNFPKFLFNSIICGVKRLAITTADMALLPPKTIINATFIKPIKLVARRINSIAEIFQELLGWTYVAFAICGVIVVYSHPEMEPWRQQIYEAYATVKDTISFEVIENATPATVNQISNELGQCARERDYYSVFYFFIWPTKKTIELYGCGPPVLGQFFRLTLETMYTSILSIPGYLVGWAWKLFTFILNEFKNAVIEGIKGSLPKLSLW